MTIASGVGNPLNHARGRVINSGMEDMPMDRLDEVNESVQQANDSNDEGAAGRSRGGTGSGAILVE